MPKVQGAVVIAPGTPQRMRTLCRSLSDGRAAQPKEVNDAATIMRMPPVPDLPA